MNIGDALEPFAGPMLTGLTAFFDLIANMDPGQLSVLIGVGAALYAIVQVVPLILSLAGGIEIVAGALGLAVAPFILIAALIAGLAYVVYHLWKTNEDFRKGILDTWEAIKTTVQPIIEDITKAIEDNWGPITEWAMKIWKDVESTVEDAFTSMEIIIKAVLKVIDVVWAIFGDNFIRRAEDWFRALGGIVGGAFDVVAGLFEALSALLQGDWSGMLDGLKKAWLGAWTAIKNIFVLSWVPIKAIWGIAMEAFGKVWDAAMEHLKNKWTLTRTWIGEKWQDFKAWVDRWTLSPGEIWKAIQTKWNDMREWVSGKWQDFKGWVSGWSVNASGLFDGFKSAFKSAINTIIGWWNSLSFSLDIPNKIPGLPDKISIGTPNVPFLAEGALVSSPTLAVIGEGSEPEIVSPESKMRQIVRESAGGKIDYAALAAAIASALRGVLGDGVTREDIERLIHAAGVNISFDRSDNEDDFRTLLFEMRRLGFGGV